MIHMTPERLNKLYISVRDCDCMLNAKQTFIEYINNTLAVDVQKEIEITKQWSLNVNLGQRRFRWTVWSHAVEKASHSLNFLPVVLKRNFQCGRKSEDRLLYCITFLFSLKIYKNKKLVINILYINTNVKSQHVKADQDQTGLQTKLQT